MGSDDSENIRTFSYLSWVTFENNVEKITSGWETDSLGEIPFEQILHLILDFKEVQELYWR